MGVNVVIQKLGKGAATDKNGKYKISNVVPGVYTLQANYIGYKSQVKKKVKLKAGKTATANFSLKAAKIKGQEVTVTASRPLIQKDYTTQKLPAKAVAPGESTTDSPGTLSKPGSSSPDSEDDPGDEESPSEDSKVEANKVKIPATPRDPRFWSPEPPPESGTPGDHSEDLLDPESGGMEVRPLESEKYATEGTTTKGRPAPRPPKSGGLKAGFADDNQQFNYFLNFLEKYKSSVSSYRYDISERVHLIFKDSDGNSLPNTEVKVFNKNKQQLLDEGKTFSDGSYFVYPAEITSSDNTFQISYTLGGESQTIEVDRNGPRTINIQGKQRRGEMSPVPVDIVFILDTTGSMGEEIERLIATIDMIHLNLTALSSQIQIRFGMVLYRDKDDRYRTRVVPLTADIDEFRTILQKVRAGGGGDTAEDLQEALLKGIRKMDWNKDGLRMGFVITDAHAHLDYGQRYTYISAALEAKKQAIKLFSVGTGGLDIRGEYILRQLSQLTYAKYLFLTYGKETGENTGGVTGSVSHHTGSNYQTDKLEAIIMRLAKEEISHFSDEPPAAGEDYFEAEKVDHETREQTLSKLFKDAISNLIDYSTLKIEDSRRLGVLPIHAKTDAVKLNAEYFLEQVQLSVAQNNQFTLIARKDLQAVLEEQKLQLSGLLTDSETTRIGELLNAELLLTGELYQKKGGYDLFLKLIRVETAEILSVTKIMIDKDLGL